MYKKKPLEDHIWNFSRYILVVSICTAGINTKKSTFLPHFVAMFLISMIGSFKLHGTSHLSQLSADDEFLGVGLCSWKGKYILFWLPDQRKV
jgi:hypothetical protein